MKVNIYLKKMQKIISDLTTLIRTNLHQFSNICILDIIKVVSYEMTVITTEHCGISTKMHNTQYFFYFH